ncbi:hypothetical protein XF_0544 [Xylella fastidiosa 9a5c]|uniref:Uncharacterized protein n=1 Tax=Xylella fastidiosa (strain 9a5c) TaxID=160492 RepID=Q9PFW3_XYLFA|nr:hypothetical protein XF_0544 [Xylella fastidiosa 9a5c]
MHRSAHTTITHLHPINIQPTPSPHSLRLRLEPQARLNSNTDQEHLCDLRPEQRTR